MLGQFGRPSNGPAPLGCIGGHEPGPVKRAAVPSRAGTGGVAAGVAFIGDDWAEDHHDLEIEDATGRRLAKARPPEGLEGISQLHAMVAEHGPAEWAELASD